MNKTKLSDLTNDNYEFYYNVGCDSLAKGELAIIIMAGG
jgi:hypothetical protein